MNSGNRDWFPFSRALSSALTTKEAEMISNLARIVSTRKNRTLYKPTRPANTSKTETELDNITTEMLFDEYVEIMGPGREKKMDAWNIEVCSDIVPLMCVMADQIFVAHDYLKSRRDGSTQFRPLTAEVVCPGSSILMCMTGHVQSIYDIDGIDYLCWRTICEDVWSRSDDDRTALDKLVSRCLARGACRRMYPNMMTCFPERSVTIRTMRGCYVPEQLAERIESDLKTLEWDHERELMISENFRSVILGGPSVASLITSSICVTQQGSTSKGDKMSDKTKQKPIKKLRQMNRMSETKLRDITTSRESTSLVEDIPAMTLADAGTGEKETAGDSFDDDKVLSAAYSLSRKTAEKMESKKRTMTGPVRGEDEFGDRAFDGPTYSLTSHIGDEVEMSSSSKTATTATTLRNLVTELWSIDASRNPSTPWTDSIMSSMICDPYENAYPCACSAELIALIVDECRKCVIDKEIKYMYEMNHQPRIPVQEWAIPMSSLRKSLRTFILELASGTLNSALANDVALISAMTSNRELLFTSISGAIHRAISASSSEIKWKPHIPTKSEAVQAAWEIPFSSPMEPEPSAVIFRNGTIRMWCGLVQHAREEIASRKRSERTQEWYFAKISDWNSAMETVRRVKEEEGMHTRAFDLASISFHSGHADKVDASQMITISSPNSWPCDISFGLTLAADALNVRQVTAGVAVVLGNDKTVVVLPHRSWKDVPGHDLHAAVISDDPDSIMDSVAPKARGTESTDAMIFGSMISMMGGTSRARSFVTGCYMIYPFAFVALTSIVSARRTESEDDDSRRLADEGGGGEKRTTHVNMKRRDRERCWNIVLRAAVAFLSDTCQSVATQCKHIAGTECIEKIPQLSEDVGAVSEIEARNKHGWTMATSNRRHEMDAMESCGLLAKILGSAFYDDPPRDMDPLIARGIVCLSRPLRMWTVDPSEIVHLLATEIPGYVKRGGSSCRVALGEDMDLSTRTAANLELMRAMSIPGNEPQHVAGALRSLALAEYDSDRNGMVHLLGPIASESCGDGSYVLPPWGETMDRPIEYESYDDEFDGSNVPSLSLLATEFASAHDKCKDNISENRVLCFMHRMELACKDESVRRSERIATVENILHEISAAVPTSQHQSSLPIAMRMCDGSFISANTHIPVADNPMTLAGSRRPTCDVCKNPQCTKRCASDVRFGGALLPKNSSLLSELIHRRNGMMFMKHAYPSREMTQVQTEYPALTIRSIITRSETKDTSTSDTTTTTSSVATDDTTEFEMMMLAESSDRKKHSMKLPSS